MVGQKCKNNKEESHHQTLCGLEKILTHPVALRVWYGTSARAIDRIFAKSQDGELFLQFLQGACQVFKGRSLIDIVNVDISDDPLLIDDKQSPFGHSVGTQHTIFLSYRSMRPKVGKN